MLRLQRIVKVVSKKEWLREHTLLLHNVSHKINAFDTGNLERENLLKTLR